MLKKGKTVKESQVIMAQQMNPHDANPAGNVGDVKQIVEN